MSDTTTVSFLDLIDNLSSDASSGDEVDYLISRVKTLGPSIHALCGSPPDPEESKLTEAVISLMQSAIEELRDVDAFYVSWRREFIVDAVTSVVCDVERVGQRLAVFLAVLILHSGIEDSYEYEVLPIRRWIITERDVD